MARPKKNIDEAQVLRLAAINCSYEEMAAVLDCDPKTLTNRFSQVIKKGREQGRMSLKRKQYEVAMGGNTTMLIWLGKQLLDQSDKLVQRTELNATTSATIKVEETKRVVEEFRALLSNSANERATQ